jgi:hypothetical protein
MTHSIYARSVRMTANGPRNNGGVALDIIAYCGMATQPRAAARSSFSTAKRPPGPKRLG